MTDTMTSQDIEISSWDALYILQFKIQFNKKRDCHTWKNGKKSYIESYAEERCKIWSANF